MKNRILSIIVITILILPSITLTAAASYSNDLTAYVSIISDSFTEGAISADVSLSHSANALVFMSYYNGEGTLLDCTINTPGTAVKTFSVNPPSVVSTGDYVKVIVVQNPSLEPIHTEGNTYIECKNLFGFDFDGEYLGISERYYTITSDAGSLCTEAYEGINALGKPVTRYRLILADEGSPFRLKDMSEGEFAFETDIAPRYRLQHDSSAGIGIAIYSASNANQRWIFEKMPEGIALRHSKGGYLSIQDGSLTISDSPYAWTISYHGETPFSKITTLDGFGLLSAHEKQRVIDICTSVGADVFPQEAVSTGNSFLTKCENSFSSLYLNQNNLTPEQEKAQILSIISQPVFTTNDIVQHISISDSFPGGNATITRTSPVRRQKVIWDVVQVGDQYFTNSAEHPYTGAPIDCYLIKVTYKTETTTQTVDVYCTDPSFVNVNTAIEALGRFPYEYRQYITTMYVYLSGNTSSYNCGGEELFVRLTKEESNPNNMVRHISHELGHSLDFCIDGGISNFAKHWCQSAEWQNSLAGDIVTVSKYGNSNHCEGLAELARLYWYSYNSRDMQIGIKQMFPNLFASYENLLKNAGVKLLY